MKLVELQGVVSMTTTREPRPAPNCSSTIYKVSVGRVVEPEDITKKKYLQVFLTSRRGEEMMNTQSMANVLGY